MPRTLIAPNRTEQPPVGARCEFLSNLNFIFAALVASASAVRAQTVQWHVVDSVAVGSAVFKSEGSSANRVRVVLSNPARTVIGADLDPVPFAHWVESIRVGLALGVRRPFEFENTLAVQPATKGNDTTGFAITVADSVGNTETVFASVQQTAGLLASLDHLADRSRADTTPGAATVGVTNTDASGCERVQDSVLMQVAPRYWPNAIMPGRFTDYRRPKAPDDAAPGRPIVAALVVLPDGSIDSSYYDVTGTRDAAYKRRVLEYLSGIKWVPGLVAGCPVVSKASLITTRIGIQRSP